MQLTIRSGQRIAVDSRNVERGDLFFALPGSRTDGHSFLREAKERGALAAVVHKSYAAKESFGLHLIAVDDVLAALQDLAKEVLAKRRQKVIAVTGSVGKTMTKEFIAALLCTKYSVEKSSGNSNSQIGLAVSILHAAPEAEWLVLEMGMSQKGEIARLAEIAPPWISVITKIGWAHAAFFASGIEGIAAAKAELLTPTARLAVVPAAAMRFHAVAAAPCPKITFGFEETAEYRIEGGHLRSLALPFQAAHLCENFAAAVAVARSLDVSWEQIQEAAHHLPRVKMRFEEIVQDGVTYVSDAYNASPESMRAALLHLPQPAFPGGRRIAVLGEMKELGPFSAALHKEVGELAVAHVDELLSLGEETAPIIELFCRAERPAARYSDLRGLKAALKARVHPGDVVLIKGSNSLRLWELLE